MEYHTLAKVIDMLRLQVEAASQKEIASQMGISAAYLCDVLGGKRSPGKKILDYLELIKVTIYVDKSNENPESTRKN